MVLKKIRISLESKIWDLDSFAGYPSREIYLFAVCWTSTDRKIQQGSEQSHEQNKPLKLPQKIAPVTGYLVVLQNFLTTFDTACRFDNSGLVLTECLRVVEKSSWHWQPGLARKRSIHESHVCHRMLFLEKTKNQDEPISHDPWLVQCYLNHFGCVLCLPVYLLPRATGFQYLIPFQRWPPLEVSLHLTSCINRKHHNLPPISVVQAAHVQSDWVEHLKGPWTAQR